MWVFLMGLVQTAMQIVSVFHVFAGSQRAPMIRYTQLKERVRHAGSNGRADRLTYLRDVAYAWLTLRGSIHNSTVKDTNLA